MKHQKTWLLLAAGPMLAAAAAAQQNTPTPRTRTNVVVASEPAKVALSIRGAEAKAYLSVQANGADVRATLNDMAAKAGVKVVLDNSAIGTITGTVDSQPAPDAIVAVAKLANLSVKKFIVPDASVATITPAFGGRYVDTLTGLPAGTVISDPTTGKSMVVSAAAPTQVTGTTVYFVHGQISPFGGGRMRGAGGMGGPGGPGGPNAGPGGNQPSQANQAFVDSTAKSLAAMPLQQRWDTMRALQRQMFQSMTDEERQQLGNMGGFGRGGFGGGRRGGGNNGGGGQPGN